MNKIFLIIVLLLAKVSEGHAQNSNYTPNPGSDINSKLLLLGSRNDPYFKDYLRIRGKEKEDQKLVKIYDRKLIVVLAEEDPKKLNYYKSSPEKLEFYRELIRTNNELLVTLIPQYWRQICPRVKDADSIIFKSHQECLELSKTKSEEYFTLEFSSLRTSDNLNLFELAAKSTKIDYRNELLKNQGEIGTFEINLIENFHKPSLYRFLTVTSFPNELDFIIAIQQMGNYFLERFKFLNREDVYEEEIATRIDKLKNKVLLIDTFQVERRNGKFSFIKEESLLPCRLTDYNGILESIKRKDTSSVYIVVLPSIDLLGDNSFENTTKGAPDNKEGMLSYSHILVNSENSEILKYIKKEERIISKKSLQKYSADFEIDKSSLK